MSERLARAALRKAEESSQAKLEFFSSQAAKIADCAQRMNQAFERGARLFAFGNGGSSCDAEHLALESHAPGDRKTPRAARQRARNEQCLSERGRQ